MTTNEKHIAKLLEALEGTNNLIDTDYYPTVYFDNIDLIRSIKVSMRLDAASKFFKDFEQKNK